MSEIAERGVMFKLMAVVDPSAKSLLASFGKDIEAAQAKLVTVSVAQSKQTVAIAVETAKAVVATHVDHSKKIEKIDKSITDVKKSIAEEFASWNKQFEVKQLEDSEKVAVSAAKKRGAAVNKISAEAAKEGKELFDSIWNQDGGKADAALDGMKHEAGKASVKIDVGGVVSEASKARDALKEAWDALKDIKGGLHEVGSGGKQSFTDLQTVATDTVTKLQSVWASLEKGKESFDTLKNAYGAFQAARVGKEFVPGASQSLGGLLKTGGMSALTGVGNYVAGSSGVAAGGSAAVVGGSAVAALTATIFGLVSTFESAREAMTHGIGGGATKGSYTDVVGTSKYNPFSRIFGQNSVKDSLQAASAYSPVGLFTGGLKQTATEKERGGTEANIIKLEQQLADNRSKRLVEEEAAGKRIVELEKMKLDVSRQQASARETSERKEAAHRREMLSSAKAAALVSLKESEAKLKSIEDQIRVKRESALSARESFGLKSEEEQAKLIDIKKRIDRGDPTVSGEEAQSVKGLSDRTDRQVSSIANRKASKGGFGIFDKENASEIGQLNQIKKRMEMEVKQKTEVVVKIDRDIEADAQRAAKQFLALQNAQDNQMAQRMAQIVKELGTLQTQFGNIRTGTQR